MTFTAGQKLSAADLNDALAATGCEAEYNATSDQTFTTGSEVNVAFGTANTTTSLVTRAVSGVGHSFTLNLAGVWLITTTCRWTASATGQRYNSIQINGSAHASSDASAVAAIPVNHNITLCKRFSLSDVITVTGFHDAGANRDMQANNVAGWNRINLNWLHP